MVQLIPLDPVPVRFQGWRAAAGPLTVGQLNIGKWLADAPHAPAAMLDQAFVVPDGVTVGDVAECFGVLLCRHEALRSRYLLGEPGEQRVLTAGEVPMAVYRAAPGETAASVAERMVALTREKPIDVAVEAPVRIAVAVREETTREQTTREGTTREEAAHEEAAHEEAAHEEAAREGAKSEKARRGAVREGAARDGGVRDGGVRDGGVIAAVAVYSHLAVDFQALVILGHEFDVMIRDPAARVVGEARQQPLDRATVERKPSHRRRLDQALRYWARQIAAAPAHLYARPRVRAAGGSGACGMSSAAAARALDHIAARTQVSRPTIVLAAVCALLSRRTGYGTTQFVMLSANRFESSLRGYVGTLAQSTYVSVEAGEAGFDELVRRCFGAVLQAGLHGAYNVHRQHEHATWLANERGIAPTYEPLFNSVVVDTRGFDLPGADGPATPTRLEWADLPPTDILLRFDLGQVDGEVIARVWSGDTGRVTREEATDLLLALERLLVAAAGGDLDHAATVAALGLPPIERPTGWLLVDHCWVDLAEVQLLLDEAVAPAPARVFADAGGEPLVAFVAAAGDGPATPAEAHRRCLELLAGRHAAMAPRRYVITDDAPADVTSLEAWQARAVHAEGPGRR
ncbi:hypothetical protein [Dactylosporangium sp. CA-092794]|uniref:hypothetical protein n=1 Tax=Dactylosporangium sp. CA-092794 TaxID=3239929 RepID=UPI003D8B1CE8